METATRQCTEKLFLYDELSDNAKERALEWAPDINVDHEWWNYDGILDVEQNKWAKWGLKDCLFSYDKIYFDLDQGGYLAFENLKVSDKEVFRRALGIPKKLWAKVYYSFSRQDRRDGDTFLELEHQSNEEFTGNEVMILDRAVAQFNDWREEAHCQLRREYEYQTSREAVEEAYRANEYTFTEEGRRHG